MRLRSIRLSGIGPAFPAEILLDLDALAGDFVAITGPNGAGKSTLVEMAAAAIHPQRRAPTRGSIDALADGRGTSAFVEVDAIWQGQSLKIRHEPNRSLSHTWLDGEAVQLDGGKVSKFAAWAREHLPPPEVVTSALVLAQKAEGLVDADPADRRAVLLRTIGVEQIEARAQKARERARDAKRALDDLRPELGRLRALPTVASVEERRTAAAASLADAESRRTAALDRLTAARAALDAYQARETERAAIQAAREAAERRRPSPAQLEILASRHRGLVAALKIATTRADMAQDGLQAARLAADAYQAREAERGAILTSRSSVERRIVEIERKVAELAPRLDAERAILADADAIRTRAARAREIGTTIADKATAEQAARSAAALAREGAAAEDKAADAERSRWRAASDRRKAAERRLADRAAVEEAAASLPSRQAAVEGAALQLEAVETELATLRTAAERGTSGRIVALRGALADVGAAEQIEAAHEIAGAGIEADDAAVSPDTSIAIGHLTAALPALRATLDAARAALVQAERAATRLPEIGDAAVALEEASAEQTEAEAAGKAAKERAEARREEGLTAASTASAIAAEIAGLRTEAASLTADVEREGALAGAEGRAAEIEAQLTAARSDGETAARELAALPTVPAPLPQPDVRAAEIEATNAGSALSDFTRDAAVAERDLVSARAEDETAARELEALPPLPEPLSRPDVAGADADLATAGGDITAASTALSLADRDLAAARETAAALASVEERLPAMEERLADWNLLADTLGLSGVQALEIDAAGPAITANMNALLHGAYGSRFTAEVTASRKSKDGKKTIDECEILILDTVRGGAKRDVRTYSGGERVPLATAFFLALAIYLCRSRGIEAPTLILDEPGSGLDDEHMGPWIDMLRAAARMAGASKTIVVTHDKRVIDAADTVVRIENGAVSVER